MDDEFNLLWAGEEDPAEDDPLEELREQLVEKISILRDYEDELVDEESEDEILGLKVLIINLEYEIDVLEAEIRRQEALISLSE